MVSWREPEVGQGLAGRDPHLRLHQVDVGDLLGHGVLDLDPRVHLDEDVVARRGRAGTPPCRRCGSRSPGRTARRPRTSAPRIAGSRLGAGAISTTFWWRRCTEQSRSKRWITLPCAVGEDLHLDVPRVDHRLLDEDRRVAEGALGLAHADLDRLAQVLAVVDPAHAAAAAAGDRLHEQRDTAGSRPPRPARRRRSTARPTPGSVRRPPWPPRSPGPCCRSASSTSAVGPTKVMPALAQASASSGFSERKP